MDRFWDRRMAASTALVTVNAFKYLGGVFLSLRAHHISVTVFSNADNFLNLV